MGRGVIPSADSLEDFSAAQVQFDAIERTVFRSGKGPAVIIVHEIPGITPEVARFARWVRDAGFTVYLPSLLGAPGRPNGPGYVMGSAFRACVAREFIVFAEGRTSPIVSWLRGLAAKARIECGGHGVGAVGMCLTGNFALGMMVGPDVTAPVLCQPSLPANRPDGLGMSAADVAAVRRRLEAEDLTVRAYRFEGDSMCRAARFEAFQSAFGARFVGETLPNSAAKPDTFVKTPHSVVTTHLIDERGSLTRRKVDEIIAFLKERLMDGAATLERTGAP